MSASSLPLLRRPGFQIAATLSWGVLAVGLLVGLVHVLSTQDITNALYVGVIFFSLGWIFRYTGNSIGPMLGWTLINGMSLAYLELVFG